MGFRGMANLQRFVEEGGLLLAVGNAGRLAVDGGIVRRVERAGGSFRTPGSELRAKVLRPEHPLAWGYEPETSVFRGSGPLWEVDERHREWVVVQFGTKKVEDLDARDERFLKDAAGADDAAPAAEEPPAEGPETGVQPPDFGAAVEGAAPEDDAGEDDGDADDDEKKDDGTAKKDLVLSGFVHGKDEVEGQPAILDVPVGRGRVILYAFNPLHRYLNHSDFRFAFNAILHWNDLPRP